ncbi:mucin-2-like [Lutzomyia longipalpis]|uniref:mucin-2-like n=1 Tax=Lutzomyia longipalpis TaxID=7200 RepID=UPI0024842E67|nr:mucin-2-like [Lutzomyia longipalpis]
MKKLGIYVLVCLAGVASVVTAEGVVCPEGRWMTTLPHEDCHQFHLCLFGRSVELKCPFGMYWDAIDGGCTSVEAKSCLNVRQNGDPPQPPVETTSWPPMPPVETTTVEDTETPEETDETPEVTDETPEETDETPDETATPPFSTTGGTPTPPFSTTDGATPTPPVSTTGGQPTPPVSTTPDESETGTPPEVTTTTPEGIETDTPPEVTTSEPEETTTDGVQTGTPPMVTTTEAEVTTVPTTLPPTTLPPTTLPPSPTPPTCPADGIHYFPDPQACNRFFLCQNGQLIHMMCAPGQIFDQTYLRCRHDGVCTLYGWLEQH